MDLEMKKNKTTVSKPTLELLAEVKSLMRKDTLLFLNNDEIIRVCLLDKKLELERKAAGIRSLPYIPELEQKLQEKEKHHRMKNAYEFYFRTYMFADHEGLWTDEISELHEEYQLTSGGKMSFKEWLFELAFGSFIPEAKNDGA